MRDTPIPLRRIACSAVMLGCVMSASVRADDTASPPVAASPPGESGAPLESIVRGPSVPDRALRTLVSEDMVGKFQRVEGRPEVAALQLLRLSADERQAVRSVLDARAEAIRAFLIDRIEEIKRSTDAAAAGDEKSAQRMRRELYDAFEPDHPRDPLLEPLSRVLPPAQIEELKSLLDEYWKAWIEAELRGAPRSKEAAVQERLVADLVRGEVQSAYEYTLRPIQRRLEKISEVVEPTPEQREAIRVALIAYVKQSRLKPTPEQRLQLSRAIYEALDEERRIKLIASSLVSE